MPKRAVFLDAAYRGATLEVIARTLRGDAPAESVEDLASWVVGVEIVESLKRAGSLVVRSAHGYSAPPALADRRAAP